MDSLRDRLNEYKPDHHYEDDPEISPVCNNIFRRLEEMPFTSFLWRQVKPLIRYVQCNYTDWEKPMELKFCYL